MNPFLEDREVVHGSIPRHQPPQLQNLPKAAVRRAASHAGDGRRNAMKPNPHASTVERTTSTVRDIHPRHTGEVGKATRRED
jgi:hypothetical protein